MQTRLSSLILMAAMLLVAIPGAPPAYALDQRSTFLPAERSRLADRTLMLGLAQAGERLVAVGAHGLIMLSDDFGASWRQARDVPTQATLTAVTFLDAHKGFAVGHDAVILKTEDGGETWAMRYVDPDRAAPLLTVAFTDEKHGLAMGGYGLVLESKDGGWRWAERLLRSNEIEDVALNKILQTEGDIFVAADTGRVYRSTNNGASFYLVQAPTTAAFWDALALPDGQLLFCGANGELWRARRDLSGWTKLAVPKARGFTAMTLIPDGRLALAGLSGAIVIGALDPENLVAASRPLAGDYAALAPGPRGKLVLLGENGLSLISDHP